MISPPKRMNLADFTEWVEVETAKLFERKDGKWHCLTCKTVANGQACAISIHCIEFKDACAGPGRVKWIDLPCCPKCEPAAEEYVSTCVHLPMIDAKLFDLHERAKGAKVQSAGGGA